jgi:hypothetical protein
MMSDQGGILKVAVTAGAEEECKAEFKPVVQLEEVEVKSGEEEETLLLDA